MELLEAVGRCRSEELHRWKATVEEYPHAITGVDTGEFLRPDEASLLGRSRTNRL
jgi:hypothetical protein